MITEFGMSEKLGPVAFKDDQDEVFLGNQIVSRPHYSDKVASLIDEEVHSIVDSCYNEAKKLLIQNNDILNELSDKLIERETLDKEEVVGILGKIKVSKNDGFRKKEYLDEKSKITSKESKKVSKSRVSKTIKASKMSENTSDS